MHFPPVPSTWHGIDYLLVSGSLLGNNLLPREIKESKSAEVFKAKLKDIGRFNDSKPLTAYARSSFLEA